MDKPQKYLSQTEIGEMIEELGWGDRRKIAVLISRGKFPEPDVLVGKIKGWKEETISKWIEEEICMNEREYKNNTLI